MAEEGLSTSEQDDENASTSELFDISITVHSLRRFGRKAKLQVQDISQQSLYWTRVKWLGTPSRFGRYFLSSTRNRVKEESAHLFENEDSCVIWEHPFKSNGVHLQKPLKKYPYEVQLAVFEAQPGCVESHKIGQAILNLATYAGKVNIDQKVMLPISGGFSSGELSLTLKVQSHAKGGANVVTGSSIPESNGFLSWTKELLHGKKTIVGFGKEEKETINSDDGHGNVVGDEKASKGEKDLNLKTKGSRKDSDKGHKRKPSRSLFARMLQDKESNCSQEEKVKVDIVKSADESDEGDKSQAHPAASAGRHIPGGKRKKSKPSLIPNSPGQLEALELVRKFQEGRNPMKRVKKLEGLWEQITVHNLPVDICFANIDQCSEEVNGHAACSTLAVAIASWMKNSSALVPDKEGELDQLIRDGSQVWRGIFEEQSELKEIFPDMHLDLETAAKAWVQKTGQAEKGVRFDYSKSFVGFLMPMGASNSKQLKDSTEGLSSFEEILEHATLCPQSLYIVAWNDHFFVIRICSPDLIYLVDTLGVRLYDGCDKAFIVRFETDCECADSEAQEESGAQKAKDKCKTFFQKILAVETLDQVVNDLSALELSITVAEEQTGEEKSKEVGDNSSSSRDSSSNGNDTKEDEKKGGEGGASSKKQMDCYKWEFLLEKLQVELQYVA